MGLQGAEAAILCYHNLGRHPDPMVADPDLMVDPDLMLLVELSIDMDLAAYMMMAEWQLPPLDRRPVSPRQTNWAHPDPDLVPDPLDPESRPRRG